MQQIGVGVNALRNSQHARQHGGDLAPTDATSSVSLGTVTPIQVPGVTVPADGVSGSSRGSSIPGRPSLSGDESLRSPHHGNGASFGSKGGGLEQEQQVLQQQARQASHRQGCTNPSFPLDDDVARNVRTAPIASIIDAAATAGLFPAGIAATIPTPAVPQAPRGRNIDSVNHGGQDEVHTLPEGISVVSGCGGGEATGVARNVVDAGEGIETGSNQPQVKGVGVNDSDAIDVGERVDFGAPSTGKRARIS